MGRTAWCTPDDGAAESAIHAAEPARGKEALCRLCARLERVDGEEEGVDGGAAQAPATSADVKREVDEGRGLSMAGGGVLLRGDRDGRV